MALDLEFEKGELNPTARQKLNVSDLCHPTEESRFKLALATTAVVIIILLTIIRYYPGFIFVIGLLILVVWFSSEIIKASLISNSIKISKDNFPQVNLLVNQIKDTLDYPGNIDIYIMDKGEVNSILIKLFNTKVIILYSELLEDMIKDPNLLQLTWIIARFVGHLKAKHLRFTYIRILINSIERFVIFNLLLNPYERATIYSGDQIGLAVCHDLKSALIAFDKFFVGNELAPKVQLSGIMHQYEAIHNNIFSRILELLSPCPHNVNRVANLLVFCIKRYPAMYEVMAEDLDEKTKYIIDNISKNKSYIRVKVD